MKLNFILHATPEAVHHLVEPEHHEIFNCVCVKRKNLFHKVNLKKLFVSGPRVAEIFIPRRPGKNLLRNFNSALSLR